MVGLTGGIGAGKSTVAEMLTKRGAVVVDADLIARQVVEPGTPALAQARRTVRPRDPRARRRARPGARSPRWRSSHDDTKRDLEEITHPAIGEEFLRQVAAAPADGIVVHDVPLLVESRAQPAVRRGDRRGGAEEGAARAPRSAGDPARGRRTADAPAGLRRGPPVGGDVGHPQQREPRRARAAGRGDLAGTAPTRARKNASSNAATKP